MKSTWYQISRQCIALRKHVLRVDLCLFIDKETAFSNENFLYSTIKSLLTASIIKGLDIVGVLSEESSNIGWKAVQMAEEQKMDIKVIPGQTYKCVGKELLYVYKLKHPVPANLTIDKVCEFAHKNGGYVVAANVTKRQVSELEKLQGSTYAPDAVEIFNDKTGGFRDFNIDFLKFISSGSTSANELEISNSFTLMDRRKLAEIGLLAEDEKVDFTPKYLLPKQQGV
jgi:hypothetical protein